MTRKTASGTGQPIKKPKKTVKKAPVKKEKTEIQKMYEKYLRSKQFQGVKEIVHVRDGERCCFCGRTVEECAEAKTQLQVHHTRYEHLGCGGEIEAADCRLFCGICHRAGHYAPSNRRWFSDKSPIKENWKEINDKKQI